MRIECDKCAAKYSIADEKVRGKTFKIRCKKCSNVIIVRDKAAAGPEDAAASEPAPADEPAGWHLAIDGDTVGPLSEDEVRRRYEAGQVDKATSVWQEGFEDWIELGQVEAFADLPDRPAAGGAGLAAGLGAGAMDDPFADPGPSDAFTGSSGSHSFDEPAPAASAPAAAAAAAESPRVDSLTGQRNENSVLFSLDSLKAMATSQKPASAGPVRQAPSTTAPSSEGSGLIDIRAMGAMMDAPTASSGGGGGSADDDVLPTFGGGGLGGLSVEPLVTEPPPAVTPTPVENKRSNAPMYILIALLASGLIAIGGYLVYDARKPDTDPEVKVVTVPGSVEEKDKEADEDEGKDEEDEAKEDAGKEEEAGETEGAAEAGEEAEVDASGKPTGKKTTKKRHHSSSSSSGGSAGVAGSSGGGSGASSGGSGGSSGGSSGGGSKEPDIDCLLEPEKHAKCKGGASGGGESKAAPDPSLPKKLGTAQIKPGIEQVKGSAEACGGKHGAAPGTKVGIKFSVKGSTGSVISAKATGDQAGTALGKCVEAAAKKAKFPKFQADQQGFQFNFRM